VAVCNLQVYIAGDASTDHDDEVCSKLVFDKGRYLGRCARLLGTKLIARPASTPNQTLERDPWQIAAVGVVNDIPT